MSILNAVQSTVKNSVTSLQELWVHVRSYLSKKISGVGAAFWEFIVRFPKVAMIMITVWAFSSALLAEIWARIKEALILVTIVGLLVSLFEFVCALGLGWGFVAAVISAAKMALLFTLVSAPIMLITISVATLFLSLGSVLEDMASRMVMPVLFVSMHTAEV